MSHPEHLRVNIFPHNPKNLIILGEGSVNELRKLQADIDTYINYLEAVDATA